MIKTAAPLPSWHAYRMVLGGLILAAWLILVILAATPYAALLDHHEIEEGAFSAIVRWPAFLGGWTLMVVAMMLPGSLPAVKSFVQAAAREVAPGRLLGSYLLGYLAVWVAFGAAIYLGDTLLHGAVDAGLAPERVAEGLIPVVLLSAAGLYQFTPLRQSCEAKCAVPQAPLGAAGAVALRRGTRAGWLCLGTCGATMLVMFALGAGVNLAWMVALTAITVAQRATGAGKYVAWPLGCVLLLWAALKLLGQLP